MHCRIEIGDAMFETTDEWEWRADSPWNLSVLVKSLEDWSLKGFFSWRDLSQDIAKEDTTSWSCNRESTECQGDSDLVFIFPHWRFRLAKTGQRGFSMGDADRLDSLGLVRRRRAHFDEGGPGAYLLHGHERFPPVRAEARVARGLAR